MAVSYLRNDGCENPVAGVESEDGDLVILTLFEYMDDRPWGIGTYTINRFTGKGTDESGNTIDLTTVIKN